METINITSGEEIISRIHVSDDRFDLMTLLGHERAKSGEINCSLVRRTFCIFDINAFSSFSGFLPFFHSAMSLDRVDEDVKSMDLVMEICQWLLDQGANRDAILVAIGGGIVSDVVGFAASIYKRGIKCVYLPTTLLSQVDASIGGKTGVNYMSYKNIVGTFKQPEFTLICPSALKTLPQEVFRDGLSEMLKAFIIEDGGNFDKMVGLFRRDSLPVTAEGVSDEFVQCLEAAVQVKAGVVSRDQMEAGERMKLNLGHTFAHAIESCSAHEEGSGKARISHGSAVAMGMAMAARLSVKLSLATPRTEERILEALKVCGLPTECPYSIEELSEAMTKDKKAKGKSVQFVLIEDIGKVIIKDMAVSEVVRALSE